MPYEPLYRSAELPPTPMPAPQFVRAKVHTAQLWLYNRPVRPIAFAQRAPYALVYHSYKSRWYVHSTGADFAKLTAEAASIKSRWRIIDTTTSLIRAEG